MTHLTDADFPAYLPSQRIDALRRAIGRELVDVRRLFLLDLGEFLQGTPGAEETDYFARNTGPTDFVFEDGMIHPLAVWTEQFSVLVLDEPLAPIGWYTLVSLRETPLVRPRFRSCLGRRCSDVRIWTFQEDIESDEAKQAAVSYVLEGEELFYGFFIHGNSDEDALMFADEVRPELVASCFSVAEGRPIRGT